MEKPYDKEYSVKKEDLNLIVHMAGELYDVGTHLAFKYLKDHEGNYDKELLVDGCMYRLDKNHQQIYRLINRLVPDDKLDGEVYDE